MSDLYMSKKRTNANGSKGINQPDMEESRGKCMRSPEIDESKLPEIMEIIKTSASLIETKDCENDTAAKKELAGLQKKLREVTGKKRIAIKQFMAYWSYTSLENAARMALLPKPVKTGLTDEQISEIAYKVCRVEYDEAALDFFIKVLKVETGLNNITDYIFNSDEIGFALDASPEEIITKILSDKK